MAKIEAAPPLYFMLSLFVLLLANGKGEPETEPIKGRSMKGLTIRLIHRDSPDSPLYRANLTSSQTTQRLVHQSKAQVLLLSNTATNSSTTKMNAYPNAVHAIVDWKHDSIFMAKVRIGKFFDYSKPFYEYFLHVNTGSSMTWVQCLDPLIPFPPSYRHYYPQTEPIYPSNISVSYKRLICIRDPLCNPGQCIANYCLYQTQYIKHLNYINPPASTGVLAYEDFTFRSNTNRTLPLDSLVFGCGVKNVNFKFRDNTNKLAGKLGLGNGRHSLVHQLGPLINSLFSYTNRHLPTTLLRFGRDIAQGPALRKTNLRTYGPDNPAYFADLQGLSLGNMRLPIAPGDLARQRNGSGGRVIDIGSAYTILKGALENYLGSFVGGV